MTSDNQSENATGCADHDHESKEEPGCTCGGICGRRELMEKINEDKPESSSESAQRKGIAVEES